MPWTRRRLLLASGALLTTPACLPATETPMSATLTHRALSSLPTTTLPWLTLRDHFIATVGAQAGRGAPLGDLLVLADATFTPGSRFPLHDHKEMEILSIVLDGTLSHHGDQAHGASVPARHAQLISARAGMTHAEGNDTATPVRMLQIWFRPRAHGGSASYADTSFTTPGRHVIAGEGGMPLRTDAQVVWHDLDAGQRMPLTVRAGRAGYLMALQTPMKVGDVKLAAGEGVVVTSGSVVVQADVAGPLLWIEVAA